MSVTPASMLSPAVGGRLTLFLAIAAGENVAGYQATVEFDASALRYIGSRNGGYLRLGAFAAPTVASRNKVRLAATSLSGESNGGGTLARLTFEVVTVKMSTLRLSEVVLSDSAGRTSRPRVEGGQVVRSPRFAADVNGDGAVNIKDLVHVASKLGQTGQNDAHVNGDGVVNIADLVLVAGVVRKYGGGTLRVVSQPRDCSYKSAGDTVARTNEGFGSHGCHLTARSWVLGKPIGSADAQRNSAPAKLPESV